MYENLDMQARRNAEKDLVRIFQRAIPEITDNAEIFYTDQNPYHSHDEQVVPLKEYEVETGTKGMFYRFTIARWLVDTFPEKEFIIVKKYHIKLPDPDSYEAPMMLVSYKVSNL